MVLDNLLEVERAARLVAFAARQTEALSLGEMPYAMIDHVWRRPPHGDPPLLRAVQRVLVDQLIQLAAADGVTPEVRAETLAALRRVRTLTHGSAAAGADAAHREAVAHDISRFLQEPKDWTPKSTAPPLPPGAPV